MGYLRAEWVAGDDANGMSPTFREGLAALALPLDVPGGTTVWPLDPAGPVRNIRGSAAPANPSSPGPRRTMEQRGILPDVAWREIGGPGKPGAAHLPVQCQRVRAGRRRKPGEELWAVWRRNLDGIEPRYYRPTVAQP